MIDNVNFKFRIKDLKKDYNKKTKHDVIVENSINYTQLDDNIKENMKENKIIGDIYNNYLRRDRDFEIEEKETVDVIVDDENPGV